MSAVLSISNLPPSSTESEIRERFREFRGFVASRLFYSERQNQFVAEIDFVTYECADYALKSIQAYPLQSDTLLIMDVVFKDQYPSQYQEYQYPQNPVGNVPTNQTAPPNRQSSSQYALPIQQQAYSDYQSQNSYQGQQSVYQQQQQQTQAQYAPPLTPPPPPPQISYPPEYGYNNNSHSIPPPIPPLLQPIPPPLHQQSEQQLYHQAKAPSYHSHPQSQLQNYSSQSTLAPAPSQRPLPPQIQNVQPQSLYRPSSSHYPQQNIVNSSSNSFAKPTTQQSSTHTIGTTLLKAVQESYNEEYRTYQDSNEATNSLYIDGIPADSNEREVSHIFRPFPGFQNVRLIRKKTQSGREFYFCFIDFEDALSASVALKTLQGYRFDKKDLVGLKISFANENRLIKKGDKPTSTTNNSNKYSENRQNYSDNHSYNNTSPSHNDRHRNDYSRSPSYDQKHSRNHYDSSYSSKYRSNNSQNSNSQKDRTRK